MDFSKQGARITLSVNGTELGLLTSVKAQKLYDKESAAMHYVVTFKRRLPKAGSYGEGDFFTASSMDIAVTEPARKVTYKACSVDTVTAEYGSDGVIYQTVAVHTALKNRVIS